MSEIPATTTAAAELSENPCLACTVNQDCCNNLTGLTVTEAEFDRCFKTHGDKIEVEKQGNLFVINANRPAPCPNWKNGGCSVYEDRPRECSLFPHNSYIKHQSHAKVSARYYAVSSCPLVNELKSEDTAAQTLVREMCEEAFPNAAEIEVLPETAREAKTREAKAVLAKLRRAPAKLRRILLRQS